MFEPRTWVLAVPGFVQRHFLWFLIGTYALSAVGPAPGRWVGGMSVEARAFSWDFRVTAPTIMLGFLLFAAGLGVKGEHLQYVFRRPTALALGLTASIIVPILLLIAVSPLLAMWHDPLEARDLLVGLTVVAAMPIAGSSAGWSQSADGDCALSLGLVLLSTLLSPFTTPLALRAASEFATGEASSVLDRLTVAGEAGTFLVVWVVVPTLLGLLIRRAIGSARADSLGLKSVTPFVLLALCYANASGCLPGVATNPDWDFLGLTMAAVALMSGSAFATGFGVARVAKADPARRTALVFGVGMANNGTGQALLAGTLGGCPAALLPLVAIHLLQHLAAGVTCRRLARLASAGS